jgi:hypothetical protein
MNISLQAPRQTARQYNDLAKQVNERAALEHPWKSVNVELSKQLRLQEEREGDHQRRVNLKGARIEEAPDKLPECLPQGMYPREGTLGKDMTLSCPTLAPEQLRVVLSLNGSTLP